MLFISESEKLILFSDVQHRIKSCILFVSYNEHTWYTSFLGTSYSYSFKKTTIVGNYLQIGEYK